MEIRIEVGIGIGMEIRMEIGIEVGIGREGEVVRRCEFSNDGEVWEL